MTQLNNPYQPRAHTPDKAAFIMAATGEVVTFGVLEARANQGAHVLRSQGIARGDHIAILMENRREMLEVCFAADRAGIYYTTISTHLSASEVDYILTDCGARLLITSQRFVDRLPDLGALGSDACKMMVVDPQESALESWTDARLHQPESPIQDEAQGLDMLYSSGTTGRPKGIKWPLEDAAPGGARCWLTC